MPIPGVAVMIKGSTVGTITDLDGHFNIKAKRNDILVFTFIGMQKTEVTVQSNQLDIKLKQESIDIDEIVAIGYGVQKRKRLRERWLK